MRLEELAKLTGFPRRALWIAAQNNRMEAELYTDGWDVELDGFFSAIKRGMFNPTMKTREKVITKAVANAATDEENIERWLMVAKRMVKAPKPPPKPIDDGLVTLRELGKMTGLTRIVLSRKPYITPSDTTLITHIDRFGNTVRTGTPLYSLNVFLQLAGEGIIMLVGEKGPVDAEYRNRVKSALRNTAENIDPDNRERWLALASMISD